MTLRKFTQPGGVLDGLVRRLGRRWERLRAHPSLAELSAFEKDLEAAAAQISSFRVLVRGPVPREDEEDLLAHVERLQARLDRLAGRSEEGPETSPEPNLRAEAPGDRPEREEAPKGDEGTMDGPRGDPGPRRGVPGAPPEGRSGPGDGSAPRGADGAPGNAEPAREGGAATGAEPAWDGGAATGAEPSGPDFPPYRDPETGLLSREGFDALGSGELKRSRRHGRPFTLLLFRLPPVENEALRTAGASVRRQVREFDLVGRHAERNLAVGLPETPPGAAGNVVDRLTGLLKGRGAWGEAAAAGLASHPEDGDTLLGLIHAARGRLAEAERGGRGAEAG